MVGKVKKSLWFKVDAHSCQNVTVQKMEILAGLRSICQNVIALVVYQQNQVTCPRHIIGSRDMSSVRLLHSPPVFLSSVPHQFYLLFG